MIPATVWLKPARRSPEMVGFESGNTVPVSGYALVLVDSLLKWEKPDTVFLLRCSDHFPSFPARTGRYAATWV